MATTANDIVLGALREGGIYTPFDILQPQDEEFGLTKLNDLMDSLSNNSNFIFYQVENTIEWRPGVFEYKIGNPIIQEGVKSELNTFSGTFTEGTNVITGIPQIPLTLRHGAWITELGGAFNNITQNTFNMPIRISHIDYANGVAHFHGHWSRPPVTANRTVTEDITYTTPGDIAYDLLTGACINRPLTVQPGFTRITTTAASGLDYWYQVVSFQRYKEYGWKAVPGPWPYAMAYNPSFPHGSIYVYPAPTQSGEVHFFSDQILTTFRNSTFPFEFPQGYSRALKLLLLKEIWSAYRGGAGFPALLEQRTVEAMRYITNTNQRPIPTSRYDSDLVASQHHDAGWIVHGGFLP